MGMTKKGRIATAALTGSKGTGRRDGLTVKTGQDNTHMTKTKKPVPETANASPMGKHNLPPTFRGEGYNK